MEYTYAQLHIRINQIQIIRHPLRIIQHTILEILKVIDTFIGTVFRILRALGVHLALRR